MDSLPHGVLAPQPLPLLLVNIAHQRWVALQGNNAEITGNEAGTHAECAQQIRPGPQVAQAARRDVERMVAGNVATLAALEHVAPGTGTAGRPVMKSNQIGEALRGPAQHAGFDFVHHVPTRRGEQAANRLPALAAVNLSGPTDVEARAGFRLRRSGVQKKQGSAADAQLWLGIKTCQGALEEIRVEAQ